MILFLPFKGMVGNRQEKLIEKYEDDPSSISETDAHTILKDIAWSKYRDGKFHEAEHHAIELLRINKVVDRNWNYGNAIYHSHTIIGLVNFERGNMAAAKNHFEKSSKTPGSPQLNAFGPTLIIAQKMIDAGERKATLKFLKNCKKFWEMDKGKIDAWTKDIQNGENPRMYNTTAT